MRDRRKIEYMLCFTAVPHYMGVGLQNICNLGAFLMPVRVIPYFLFRKNG